jgi:hypothetical protein
MGGSIYPADFFEKEQISRKVGLCFVLMPFREGLKEIFETIKEVVEGPQWNFVCKRADDFFAGGHILADVLRGIGEAEVVVADLTDRNPNVFYELGIAHMVKQPKEIILLAQSIDAVPFDLRAFRCIVYSQSIQGAKKLKADFANTLGEITEPVYRFKVNQRQSYSFAHKLFGESRCLYDFSLFADYLGLNGAKFTLRVRRYVAGEPEPTEVSVDGYGIAHGDTRQIPKIPWDLRLDHSDGESASFSVIRRSNAPH